MSENHLADFLGADLLGESKEEEKSKSIFGNTGWLTPAQLLEFAKEVAVMAQEAHEKQVFVRTWCDKGEKSGKPYFQIRLDNIDKVERWKAIQEIRNKKNPAASFASDAADLLK